MNHFAKTAVYKDERTWFFAAVTLVALFFLLYAYFVISSVVHVVIRKELAQEAAALNSYVSQLEASYIDAQHAVSEEIASQRGYTKVEHKIFVDKTPATLVLSLQNES
jgi:hypothetical protein